MRLKIYIQQNLRYYKTIEQIHFMVVKEYKAMLGKKIIISDPLLYRRPLLLRQQKSNQNQTNTTGAQNLKEFNNTTGWLSVFFGVFFL